MDPSCVFIVEDDYAVLDALGMVLDTAGYAYQTFISAENFLETYRPISSGILLLDINLPGISGLDLQDELIRRTIQLPIIFLTGQADMSIAARALKAGAADFLTKPVSRKLLIERIQAVLPG
jgi:two-component system, LuxR family, response regulator FixJ